MCEGRRFREDKAIYEEIYSGGGYRGKEEVLTKLILKHVGNDFVLDVGCGDAYLLNLVGSGVGVDFSIEALKRAKREAKNHKTHLILADISVLPLRDKSFSCVMCIEVLEHLWDPSRCLVEINRVLKDEGKAVIVVPNTASLTKRLALLLDIGFIDRPEHIQHFTFNFLKRFLQSNGFKVLEIMGDELYLNKYRIGRKVAQISPRYANHILAIVEKS